MADAVDEGQASGQIAGPGDDKSNVRTSDITTLDEIGVSRQRLSEWRELRDAGLDAVDAAINEQLAVGKAPTKSGIHTILAGLSGNNEWYTPVEWIERARAVMGTIDCDPASAAYAQKMVNSATWFDKERDGLKHDWRGNVWLNPPYGRGLIEPFIKKLLSESPNVEQAIVLTDSRTDTHWFHELCSSANALAFTKGRINFYSESAASSSPVTGSASTYIGHNVERFRAVFRTACFVIPLAD
jgi:hypothetical protein